MIHKLSLVALFFASVVFSGCVIQPVGETSAGLPGIDGVPADIVGSSNSSISAYALKPGDPIYVRFSGIMEQQPLDMVIDENGEISLLHIGEPIKAAGLTTSVLEKKIERLYIDGGIYKNVSVNVTMTAKVYYVQGEVNQPGQFPLSSGTTLLQAIAGSRGYTPFANRKKVTITRQGKVYRYNMKNLEKDPTRDVKIEAGDVIKVWQSRI